MTASEIKTLVQLENKYKTVVVWHRIYEYKEKIIFVLRRVYIVSADSEDELDTWMRGFLEYVGISGATPLQHSILNDCGADYDVEIQCDLT